jgi:L-malate glycosyltransferase
MMYKFLIIKRVLEDIFIFPFILIGRCVALLQPLKKEYEVFFFFPFYHIGGAEKVHSQIVQATGNSKCIIFFTRKSVDPGFLEEFKKSGCEIKDISRFTDNKWLYFMNLIYRGIISGYINNQTSKASVFNGQCNFSYKISPWINKKVTQIELIHSFNSFSYIRIPFLPLIDKTVMISKKRIADHMSFYKKKGIPDSYASRICYISNAIQLPSVLPPKANDILNVLYVGRGGKEKRVELIAAMAKELHITEPHIKFQFLGDVSNILEYQDYPYIHFYGNVSEQETINSIYAKAHILILTSDTEGFPMVVIEGMANGCAILATPVGDIPYHIHNNENGFLFSDTDNLTAIVSEGVVLIKLLKNDRAKLNRIAATNIQYANAHFGIEQFNKSYSELIKQKVN